MDEYKPLGRMNIKELKQYIRDAIDIVNVKIDNDYYFTYQQDAILDDLRNITNSKDEGNLYYGFGKKNKAELLHEAERLRTFIKIDTDIVLEHGSKKAYNAFKKSTGVDLSYDAYNNLMDIFGALGGDIVEKYGSSELANVFEEFAGLNGTDLLREANRLYRQNRRKKTGMTKQEMLDCLKQTLREKYNKR